MSEDITFEKNYPIVEVLVEYRFANIDLSPERVNQLQEAFRAKYPIPNEITAFHDEIAYNRKNSSRSHQESPRYQFISEDHLSLVQMDSGLFAINKLRPYKDWESFLEIIKESFAVFVSVQDIKLNTIVLQYINKIPVEPGIKLESIMNFRPQFEGPFTACSAAVVLPNDEIQGIIHMQMQTVQDGPESSSIMFLLTAQAMRNDLNDYVEWLNIAHQKLNEKYNESVVRTNVEENK